ncbi:MAG: hypothetical protein LBC97_15325 [Bifidobacteriaceae bacterium]|nr:hypothetical protein [Bifidobacteriaceae bacterium]
MRKVFRLAAAGLGGLLLTGVGSLAFADTEQDADDVAVKAEISALAAPGVLAMSVAGTEVALTETGSHPTVVREFTGSLPVVTVTDSRDPAAIDPGAYWYVLGVASDFAETTPGSGIAPIPAAQFGWEPVITAGDSTEVSRGVLVATSLDTPAGPGLTDGSDLLADVVGSSAAQAPGQWKASAGLVLKTAPTVPAGSYQSTLTLTLFE